MHISFEYIICKPNIKVCIGILLHCCLYIDESTVKVGLYYFQPSSVYLDKAYTIRNVKSLLQLTVSGHCVDSGNVK